MVITDRYETIPKTKRWVGPVQIISKQHASCQFFSLGWILRNKKGRKMQMEQPLASSFYRMHFRLVMLDMSGFKWPLSFLEWRKAKREWSGKCHRVTADLWWPCESSRHETFRGGLLLPASTSCLWYFLVQILSRASPSLLSFWNLKRLG